VDLKINHPLVWLAAKVSFESAEPKVAKEIRSGTLLGGDIIRRSSCKWIMWISITKRLKRIMREIKWWFTGK
jgi:hypothetical protein